MLRVSPPACSIRISPSLRLTTLGNFSPHSTSRMASSRGHLFKAYGLQLALVFNAVEIDVVELDLVILALHPAPAIVFMNQGEGGAGHFIRIGGIQGLRDSLHQRGLACAKVSAQKEQSGRMRACGQFLRRSRWFLWGCC